MLALLNSQLLEWRFRMTSSNNMVSTGEIASLPLRRIHFTTPKTDRQRRMVELVRKYETDQDASLLAAVEALLPRDENGNFLAFVHGATGDEEESDVVHDLLAYLAEQMVAMHKQRQTYLRAFRLDLAGYLSEKQLRRINRLYTPKKPPREGIKNYDKKLAAYEQAVTLAQAQLGPLSGGILTLDDFWRLNQAQWMWVLRQRLGKVADMSALVAVYEGYRVQLAPLMRRLRRTDWLIDQVVYRLYGLTEDEIAVVEGR